MSIWGPNPNYLLFLISKLFYSKMFLKRRRTFTFNSKFTYYCRFLFSYYKNILVRTYQNGKNSSIDPITSIIILYNYKCYSI